MVAQGPLEAFVMVRIHVGQPFSYFAVLSDPPIPSTFNFQVPAPQFQPSSINPLIRLSATPFRTLDGCTGWWTDAGRILGKSTLKKPKVFVFLARWIPISARVYRPWTDKKCKIVRVYRVVDGWTDKTHLCIPAIGSASL